MPRKAEDSMELKTRSYRVDDETQEKIERLTSSVFGSKNECLKSLIQLYELQESKKTLPGFTADIDNFRAHLSSLEDAFIHILHLNADAELRIEERFSLELSSNAKTIASLQEALEKSKNDLTSYKEMYREERRLSEKRLDELTKSQSALGDKNKLVQMLEAKNSQLTENLAAANDTLSSYEERISHLESLETEIERLKSIQISLEDSLSTSERELAAVKKASEEVLAKASADAADNLAKALQQADFEKEKAVFALEAQHQEEINALKRRHLEEMQEMIQKYHVSSGNPSEKE